MLLKAVFCFLFGLLFFVGHNVAGQDQRVADSLAQIYEKNVLEDTAKLELLLNLSFNEAHDLNLALRYAQELIDLAEAKGNIKYLYTGYFLKGNKKSWQISFEFCGGWEVQSMGI